MCGRFSQYLPASVDEAADAALRGIDPSFDLATALNAHSPAYNIAPGMPAAVLARSGDGPLQLKPLRWGLVPRWAKDPKIGYRAFNARMETVADKPMFRAAVRKRRCVVPMSGYFEWQALTEGKQPWFIHAADRNSLLCAGLWEAWRPNDQPDADWLQTFCVLTRPAGPATAEIHHRQPVMLPAERLVAWLADDADHARAALADLPEADLARHRVHRRVGAVQNQDAGVVEPLPA